MRKPSIQRAVLFRWPVARLAAIFVLAIHALVLRGESNSQASSATDPNIIIIMADDLGYGDVSCYGATEISTPNIDRLARGGIRFTSGYCSASTCTPTRYSLLTGNYAFRKKGTGVAPPNSPALIAPGTVTIASQLKQKGYRTAVIGKWHLGLGKNPAPNWNGELVPGPLEIGFDHCLLLPTTNDRVPQVYVRDHLVEGLDPSDPLWVGDNPPPGGIANGISHRPTLKMDWSHGHNQSIHNGIGRIGYYTGGQKARFQDEDLADRWVEESKRWIESEDDAPFFLLFTSHDVHVPRMVHPRFQGSTGLGPRGDAILELDWSVGELLSSLQSKKLLDNTLIVFCSDNGPVLDDGYKDQSIEKLGRHLPAGPFKGGKYNVFEGGTRTPWIVSWPAKINAGVSSEMVCTIDLLSSLSKLVRVPVPESSALDSFDLLDAMLGVAGAKGRDHLVQQDNGSGNYGFRKGKWKLLRHRTGKASNVNLRLVPTEQKELQLYDLESDPSESLDVSQMNPLLTTQLNEELDRILQSERTRPSLDSNR